VEPQKLDYGTKHDTEREPANWWVLIITMGVIGGLGLMLAVFAFTR
jgi:hypothetical protein